MAYATDSLIEAENMIRSTIANFDDQQRALQICRWLFGFNSVENGFKVKCYSRKIPDICFCIDRDGYGDCEGDKVRTFFFCIGHPIGLVFRPVKIDAPYFKYESAKKVNYISPSESKKLDHEILKKHIFDSYEFLLTKLKLVSNVSRPNIAPQQRINQPQDGSYLPTKEDFESAYRELTRPGEAISIDTLLDQMAMNATNKVLSLKSNWRVLTEKNIEIWAKTR